MTKDDLMRGLEKINALENELMRPLTEKEINLFVSTGDEFSVYENLGMDRDDLEAMRELKLIITAYYTAKTDEQFAQIINSIDLDRASHVLTEITKSIEDDKQEVESEPECSPSLSDVVREIVESIFAKKEDEKEVDPECVIDNTIERLKSGETVDVNPSLADAIIDRISNTYDNYNIVIKNNKAKATFE